MSVRTCTFTPVDFPTSFTARTVNEYRRLGSSPPTRFNISFVSTTRPSLTAISYPLGPGKDGSGADQASTTLFAATESTRTSCGAPGGTSSRITDTVSLLLLATNTRDPSGLTATPSGSRPTRAVATICSRLVSITDTVLPCLSVAYTVDPSEVTATPRASWETGMLDDSRSEPTSMTETDSAAPT